MLAKRVRHLRLLLGFVLISTTAATLSQADISGSYVNPHRANAYDPDKDEWSSYEISDILVLQQNNEGDLHFCFELYFTNGHQCVMQADARRVEQNRYEYLARDPGTNAVECRLTIYLTAQTITLRDMDASCQAIYCGARGIIDGNDFDRATKTTEELNCGFKY